MSAVSNFVDAYIAACESALIRPRASVKLEAEDSAGQAEPMLRCNGNSPALRDSRMLDVDAAPLAKALSQGHPFAGLDLSYNSLGPGAAAALSDLLRSDSYMAHLDLSMNDLTEPDVAALCVGLKANSTLRELRLSGNKLRPADDAVPSSIAEALQANEGLTAVHLSNCELSTRTMVALATVLRENKSIATLDISRPLMPMHENATTHFSRMLNVNTTLTDLDLSKCGFRDEGLHLLATELLHADASGLNTLRACGNQIRLLDKACVESFAKWLTSRKCRLQTLLLGANQLRDEGTLVLADIVPANSSLLKLDLTSNSIMSRGLCALGPVALSHDTLAEVTLQGNRFDPAACLAWLPVIKVIELDFTVQETDGTFFMVEK